MQIASYTSQLTKQQFINKFNKAIDKAYMIFFKDSPVDTGYLRSQIQLVEVPTGFIIYNEVFYMEYTEEEWTGRMSHLTNPNQGWFKRSFEKAYRFILQEVSS